MCAQSAPQSQSLCARLPMPSLKRWNDLSAQCFTFCRLQTLQFPVVPKKPDTEKGFSGNAEHDDDSEYCRPSF
jgi:hypothetical protein